MDGWDNVWHGKRDMIGKDWMDHKFWGGEIVISIIVRKFLQLWMLRFIANLFTRQKYRSFNKCQV